MLTGCIVDSRGWIRYLRCRARKGTLFKSLKLNRSCEGAMLRSLNLDIAFHVRWNHARE